VIKNIAYYPLNRALNAEAPMAAMLSALTRAGIQPQPNSMNSDAVLIWSVLWSGRMAANQAVYQHYRSLGRSVIVADIGTLQRGTTWKVAVNNINAQGYYGHQDQLDWDRPKKLGLILKTPTNPRPHVTIAAQHSKSEQSLGIDFNQWAREQIQILKHNTDRPIHVRPHPRCRLDVAGLGVTVEQPAKIPGTYDSFDLALDCHAIVNYNSGPGIQAAISGVRPIVHHTSLAYPVSVGYADIEQPYITDRDLWLTQISHTEYTLNELEQGLWLNRIHPAL
jgi:hypothetical protein